MRRKLRSRGGFSLAECLVTLAILSLMSSVACMGVSIALHDRARAITTADAQTVTSTAAQAVADQIRYGRLIQVEDTAVVLESSTYGARVRLALDSEGHVAVQSLSDLDNSPVGQPYALLGEKAYSGLVLDQLKFEPVMDGDRVESVKVTLSVDDQPAAAGTEDSEHLWSLEYTVAPLNPRVTSDA